MHAYASDYLLIEKQPASRVLSMVNLFSWSATGLSRTAIIKPLMIFFGLQPKPQYKISRIKRRYNKSFEEFIFKGYDQQQPGLSRPGSFKKIRMICKN